LSKRMSKKKNTKKSKNCTRNLEREKSAKTMKNKKRKNCTMNLKKRKNTKNMKKGMILAKAMIELLETIEMSRIWLKQVSENLPKKVWRSASRDRWSSSWSSS